MSIMLKMMHSCWLIMSEAHRTLLTPKQHSLRTCRAGSRHNFNVKLFAMHTALEEWSLKCLTVRCCIKTNTSLIKQLTLSQSSNTCIASCQHHSSRLCHTAQIGMTIMISKCLLSAFRLQSGLHQQLGLQQILVHQQ